MEEALNISKLEVGFKSDSPLIKDINLIANRGDCIGLMGRNGEGKTSLLKTLTGLMSPLSGKVIIGGKDLHQMDARQKAAVMSIVLTEKPMIANISVEDLIGFGRYPFTGWLGVHQSKDLEMINEAIELCELSAFRNRKIAELSDGERQRVMIARCLAQNTGMILLDEPTIHLDVSSKLSVFKLLQSIALEKNVCVIFITHELNLAIEYCSKIWLLNDSAIQSVLPHEAVKDGSINQAFGID